MRCRPGGTTADLGSSAGTSETAVADAHTASLIHPLMTARRCREDMIERSDGAERIEPKLAKEPMENADANDPVEPIDRNEPTLPIDKIDFLGLRSTGSTPPTESSTRSHV